MDMDEELALLVKRVQHRHHRAFTEALADLDVSLVQWDTLRHLSRNPQASLHDLAQLTFQTDQSFGTLAARMVQRGLLERIDGPGRAVRHRITAEGERVRREGERRTRAVRRRSFAGLSDTAAEQLAAHLRTVLGTPIEPTRQRAPRRRVEASSA